MCTRQKKLCVSFNLNPQRGRLRHMRKAVLSGYVGMIDDCEGFSANELQELLAAELAQAATAAVFYCDPACTHGAILMSYPIKSPRKLIEVALPLDAINIAAAKEKSIRHGHPSLCTCGGRGAHWQRRGR